MASSSSLQMGDASTKRKRQILPLGLPPSQTTFDASLQSGEQRTALRVNRACNTCRRQKMRCEGPGTGVACSRCQNSGVECVFEKVPPNKPPTIPATSRLSSLEEKVELLQSTQLQIQQSIQEILTELKNCSSILQKRNSPDPETINPVKKRKRYDIQETIKPEDINDIPNQPSNMSIKSHTTTPPSTQLTPNTTNAEMSRSPSKNSSDSATPSTHAISSPAAELHVPYLQTVQSLTIDEQSNLPNSYASSPEPSTIGKMFAAQQTPRSVKAESINEAKGGDDRINETSGKNIIGRLDARSAIREDKSHGWNPQDQTKDFHVLDASYPDPVERGLITTDEAQRLFDLFFDKCHPRMPIFDPRIDTFQSLRQRSVFCFCCILMVAARARDGANPTSLQNALWDEAMARAKVSMFHRVTDLEVIQSLLLLAAWSESTGGTCWILTGHAIRCAVEMGIHKALTKLTAASETCEAEKTQILVSSARVWCALFAFEYQLSFGIGRHTMTGHPRSIKNARDALLRHPLSQLSDMRLVSACEIMDLEYHLLETLPTTDADDPRCQAHLQEARTRMDQWFADWDTLVGKHYPIEHYMRQTLRIHKEYVFLTLHMAGMPRVITSEDLDNVSANEKLNCVYAISAAKEIARISVEEPSYRDGLKYSPTCFYSGVSFVGALLLRLGVVLKDDEGIINQYAVKLFHVLLDVPTCRFKFQFVSLLKAKELIPEDSAGDQESTADN